MKIPHISSLALLALLGTGAPFLQSCDHETSINEERSLEEIEPGSVPGTSSVTGTESLNDSE